MVALVSDFVLPPNGHGIIRKEEVDCQRSETVCLLIAALGHVPCIQFEEARHIPSYPWRLTVGCHHVEDLIQQGGWLGNL